jgi:hypothetical protein
MLMFWLDESDLDTAVLFHLNGPRRGEAGMTDDEFGPPARVQARYLPASPLPITRTS